MPEPAHPIRRSQFLKVATAFEAGLIVLAYALGWLVDIDPMADFRLDPVSIGWGLAGTLPLYALFVASYRFPLGGMREIKTFLIDKLGPFLNACSPRELLYLGFLAGVSEEVLFRGFLQPWFEAGWGWLGGLLFSNMVFALAHWITPLYGLLAALTGIYLGLALDVGSERNVLIPILIHSIYDFLAFLAVTKSYREQVGRSF